MLFSVYILKSISGKYYIGQTNNLSERINRHNSGRSRYTKSRGPWELVYSEAFATREEAVRREQELKRRHIKGVPVAAASKSVQG